MIWGFLNHKTLVGLATKLKKRESMVNVGQLAQIKARSEVSWQMSVLSFLLTSWHNFLLQIGEKYISLWLFDYPLIDYGEIFTLANKSFPRCHDSNFAKHCQVASAEILSRPWKDRKKLLKTLSSFFNPFTSSFVSFCLMRKVSIHREAIDEATSAS